MRRIGLLLAALTLLAATARAQTLQEGESAWMNADFRRAATIFEHLVDSPDADRETIVQAHRHLAAIALLRHDRAGAVSHVRLAVALDASVQAPDGAPDELAAILDRARRESGGPAEISLSAERAADATVVSATLSNSPEGLVTRLLLRCRGTSSLRAEETGPPPTLSLRVPRPEDTPSCEAHAQNRAGVSLVDGTLTLDAPASMPIVSSPGGADVVVPAHGDDTWIWILGTSAVLLAVAAAVIVIAVVVTSASSADPSVGGFVVRGW